MRSHFDVRLLCVLAFTGLGLVLCVRLGAPRRAPAAIAARAALPPWAVRRAPPRERSSLTRLLGSLFSRAAGPHVAFAAGPAALAAAPATCGGTTLAECLAGRRRPALDDELRALEPLELSADLSRALALETTDRAYHAALARASAQPAGEALRTLEEALADLPPGHRVARVRLLEAMLPAARAVRPLAERQELLARLHGERAALAKLAAPLLPAAGAAAASQAVAHAQGAEDALEPLLATLAPPRTLPE